VGWLVNSLLHFNRLTVLIYHRVLARAEDSLFDIPTAAGFEDSLRQYQGFAHFLSLPEALSALAANRLPANAAVVTFDDGYADNLHIAAPILQKLGIPATFFIATQVDCMFNDRIAEALRLSTATQLDLSALEMGLIALPDQRAERAALADRLIKSLKHRAPSERQALAQTIQTAAGVAHLPNLMMCPSELQALAKSGMQIGAHTRTHPILTTLTDVEAQTEIVGSKADLENLLQQPVDHFAYPNGVPDQDYAAREVALVKAAGFKAAFSTSFGAVHPGSDPFQLPRFTPWSSHPVKLRLHWWQNQWRNPALAR
jgi:peptidoglycan/xylan/chitin deacetylase (PgdA/CDA1 family)